jgi:hypothetical protein
MSEIFKFVNNALTTQLQQSLLKKIADHTGVTLKQIKASLDKERSEKYGVLAFSTEGCPIKEEFYVASGPPIDPNDFLSLRAFEKSKFYEQKTIMNAVPERQSARLVFSTPELWVQASVHEIVGSEVGGGAIFLNYPGFRDELLLPLSLYLSIRYPSPSQE